MKKWIFILFAANSLALAVTSPFPVSKFPQIIEKPNSFKSDEFYDDSEINPGYKINKWEWNFDAKPFGDKLSLSKTKDGKGWSLYTGYTGYSLDKIAKNRKLLYTVSDISMKQKYNTFQISLGKFKNIFLKQTVFEDGTSSVHIQNREYTTYEAKSSSFDKSGATFMTEYNMYAYLFSKKKFCAMNDGFSVVNCES